MTVKATVSAQEFASWYDNAQQRAIANGIELAELDWLVQRWTNLDRLALRMGNFQQKSAILLYESWENIQRGWQRRLEERCPVQYLLGKTNWRNFSLRVTPAVLIPRPETELIIDIVQAQGYSADHSSHWVDLGTGSGAIALGLAEIFPQGTIHGVDRSREALAIARDNARLNQLEHRIQFHQGDWWHPLDFLKGQVQGMVSNPPYIPQAELSQLPPEVIDHEPVSALDGGQDGLASLRQLIRRSPIYLQPGGFWLVEVMAGQACAVATLLEEQGCYKKIQIHPDLAGIERFVSAQFDGRGRGMV